MELRELQGRDIFPMVNILKKIGVKEFKTVFDHPEAFTGDVQSVGMTVFMDLASIVIANLGDAEDEIFTFLGNLTGAKRKELEELPMNEFVELVIRVFQKDEFRDFMKVVSGLFS